MTSYGPPRPDPPSAAHATIQTPGTTTICMFAVSLPWWVRRIQKAAEAVVAWTRRFETHTRIR